ncbi:TonB-dependent receptor plug domain-containing protein [Rhizorhabdus phycosphaerae]|uniref:TonB-dependent receptor plug domain-containing protein n=1 Tax=Rhizorhabdus phycosphaerae TaxID=2711156 RepID=UPI0013ECCE56|nr:TonB-dependent receptor [Rhizorhabdus phycosphaerae]
MDIGAAHPVIRSLPLAVLALAIPAQLAAAETRALDLPAGRLGEVIGVLAKQTGASVSVSDRTIWTMRVAALRGRMDAEQALKTLLRGSRARVVPIGGNAFRIVPAETGRGDARPGAPMPPIVTEDDQSIVVTASKRDTRLRDFAGSVSLLDGADLTFGGEQGMESVLARVASLSSTHLGAGRNKLFIRGIADSSFTGPTQATVGQYLGDMRLTYNAPDPDLRLYDIQSVEILEGPQGTLYGAGSLGGVIRVIRNAPRMGETGAALSAGLAATQHGDPSGDIGGMVNIPVADDRIALRAVGYGLTEGGYIDDVWRRKRDINRTRVAGGRATLRFDMGDGWTVDLGGVYQDNEGRDGQYADRALGGLNRASRVAGGFDADYGLGELVISKQWDGLSFLSSTGYVRQDLRENYDASVIGQDRQFRQTNRTRMFASENRLWRPTRDGFGWVIGASYTHNRTDLDRALGPVGQPLPVTGVTNRISEFTAYAEASVEPLRGMTVTGGARYTRSRLGGGAEQASPVFSPTLEAARAAIVARRTEERVLPSASISAALLPRLLVFARYQEGFRPGGLAVEGGFVRRFLNDRVSTMETGLRYGQRGRDPIDLSLSLSYTRWRNIQADFIDAGGLPTTDNIGDGRIYSLSGAIGWSPIDNFVIDAAATYNNSRVTDPSTALLTLLATAPVNSATGALTGGQGRIPNVARFTTRVGADYKVALDDRLDLRINGWIRYIGKSRLGIGPILGDLQGDYVDTALTVRIGRPDFGVSLGMTNLTDAIGNRFALGTPFAMNGGRQITPLRPRTIRIGLDRSF